MKEIGYVLSRLINLSFKKGIFPNCLKIAKVVPIHKGGSFSDLNNYRPTSILPVISKVYERVMYIRIYNYFERLNLFKNFQYGFRSKRSTVDAIIEIVEKLRSESLRAKFDCLFLDLSKAFDTVNHSRLLSKLERYGIRGMTLRWIESYLNLRYQFVSFNGHSSDLEHVQHGVPQGSILGPLLFIIYINDLDCACNRFRPTVFADDTNLLSISPKEEMVFPRLKSEFEQIVAWFEKNAMHLNVERRKACYLDHRKLMTTN
ncbi:MAG: reverse transcriptase family protein [Bacteroidota bacterium]